MVGRRLLGQPKERLDHPRNLLLAGASISAHGGLHLLGRIAGAGHMMLARGEHYDAAGMPDGERGAHVLAEVELLERDGVGPMLLEQRIHARVYVRQAELMRGVRARFDHSAVQRDHPPASACNDAIAGVGKPRVYPENYHE